MSEMNDEGIYRPLFVLVEAVEAEAKRQMEVAENLSPARRESTASMLDAAVREHSALREYVTKHTGIERIWCRRSASTAEMLIGGRCVLCRVEIAVAIDETAIEGPRGDALIVLIDRLNDVGHRCEVELGDAGQVRT